MAKHVRGGLLKTRPKELKGLKCDIRLKDDFVDVYILDSKLYIRFGELYSAWLVYELDNSSCITFRDKLGYIIANAQASNGELYRAYYEKDAYRLAWDIAVALKFKGYLQFTGFQQNILKDIIQEE